jgi:HNH endonuclease
MVVTALLIAAGGQRGISDGDGFVIFMIFMLAAVFLLVSRRRNRRSRYIPVKSKRLAQAKLFQKHYSDSNTVNKPLRLRDYEYDHKHPFSRGGSADPENIELITRKENRRKGKKPR